MIKVLLAVLVLIIFVAVASVAYDKGWSDGYIEGIVSEQKRSVKDGQEDKNKSM